MLPTRMRFSPKIFSQTLLSLLTLVVCFAYTTGAQAGVTGTVTDSTSGSAIASAWVYFGSSDSTMTNASGTYNFPNLAGGNYTVVVRKSGYLNRRQSATLVTGNNTLDLTLRALTAPLNPIGWWDFDDATRLTGGKVGRDFTLVGTQTATTGPATGDGAVNIGVGSYYRCFHDMAPNGGSTSWVNEYTIVVDFKVPSIGQWYTFHQTNYQNINDGDGFVNLSGSIGVGATGYSWYTVSPNEWYRLVISVDLGSTYRYYLDGQLLQDGGVQSLDGRFALYPNNNQNQILFFADDNGEDNPINVAQVMLYDRPLTAQEAATLGGYGHNVANPATIMTPYLQAPGATEMTIGWHYANSPNSVVEYGTTPALGLTQIGGSQTIGSAVWHGARLTGLTPNTRYYYRCVSDTARTAIASFHTVPANGANSGHVRFLLISDSQSNITTSTRVATAMRETLVSLYGDNFQDSVNLVMHSGDIVGNGMSYSTFQTEYFLPFRELNKSIPFMVSIGNHEGESPAFYQYMEYANFGGPEGERYYSFQLGRVLFIALNSNLQGTTQLNWLSQRLANAQADSSISMIFVSTHHPAHSEVWPDGNTSWTLNSVLPLLENTPKAVMITNGHSHNYERGARENGNLRTVLCGGAGGSLDRWRMYTNQTDYPEIHRSLDYYHYVLIDVNLADSSYSATTYSLGNPDHPMNNVVVDRWHQAMNRAAPAQPQAIAPTGNVSGAFALQASPFAGSDSIQASQFQLTATSGNYSSPLINSLRNFENYYLDSGAPDYTPINRNAGIDLSRVAVSDSTLTTNRTYWWRVRYRDQNLKWSAWSAELSFSYTTSGVNEPVAPLPQEWLAQNYPNPFNATTTIAYSIKQPGAVRLTIYDELGRQVSERTMWHAQAGVYTLPFDGRALASGRYVYTISSNGYTATRSMVLVK